MRCIINACGTCTETKTKQNTSDVWNPLSIVSSQSDCTYSARCSLLNAAALFDCNYTVVSHWSLQSSMPLFISWCRLYGTGNLLSGGMNAVLFLKAASFVWRKYFVIKNSWFQHKIHYPWRKLTLLRSVWRITSLTEINHLVLLLSDILLNVRHDSVHRKKVY